MSQEAAHSRPETLPAHPVAVWGIIGAILLLLWGVYRVLPHALEPLLKPDGLAWWHLALYAFSVAFNAYFEGYKGFHKGVAPRVVSRAHELTRSHRPIDVLLAPLYCTSFYSAERRVLIVRYVLFTTIVAVIVLMRMVPQPWRGIVDAGVVVGLAMGAVSIGLTYYRSLLDPNWNSGLDE